VLAEGHSRERANINLARIPPFCLNSLKIMPATRQIELGGKSETLEPRIMQVLVALWQAQGAVVTRDDLIASCWDGRIVGDNAIQRAISRLREIAAGLGAGCFRLETVSKVGYRLVELGSAPAMAQTVASGMAGLGGPVTAGVAAAVAAIIVAVVLFFWQRASVSGYATISVVAAQGQASQELASGLAIDLARFANTQGDGISFVNGKRGDYRLTVLEKRAGNRGEADVALLKAGSSAILWSDTFVASLSDPALLHDRIANAVSAVTQCALRANNDPARTPSGALQLVFAACESLNAEPETGAVEQWRRVVAKEPDNAPALATLAFVEAEWSTWDDSRAEAGSLRMAAWRHLRKARSIDASLGLTYAAEAWLIPFSGYGERIATLDRGLGLDPNCAFLHMSMGRVRNQVGRTEDGLTSARRAVSLAPSSPWFRSEVISALAYDGYPDDARSELRAAERLWPDSFAVQEVRSRVEFRFGDPAELIQQIDRGSALPGTSKTFASGVQRSFLLARATPSPQNIENAVRTHLHYTGAPQGWLQTLVALGRVDQAYGLMKDPRKIARLRQGGTDILFRVHMSPFVLDKRFMALADRLGLVQYWMASDAWPDFCDDKDIAYNCKAEAARLHAKPA